MQTTYNFVLPFPILGLPDDGLETTGPSNWWDNGVLKTLDTRLHLRLNHHDTPRVMELLGWKAHGSGKSTYGGDTKGMFAVTEVEMAVEGIAVHPMAEPVQQVMHIVSAINTFIEQFTTQNGTLWTPRATPQDIIGHPRTHHENRGQPRHHRAS